MRGGSRADHYIRLRWSYDHYSQIYRPEWSCHSTWDIPDGGRLRREMCRTTTYSDVKQAQRWARKYGVECPMPAPVQGCANRA